MVDTGPPLLKQASFDGALIPSHLLPIIFRHLSQRELLVMEMVSKEYRAAVLDMHGAWAYWACINESIFSHLSWDALSITNRTPALHTLLLRHGGMCRKLRIRNVRWLGLHFEVKDVMSQTFQSCGSLQVLDLSGCVRLATNLLEQLIRYCPQLRVLRLRGCQGLASGPSHLDELKALPRDMKLDMASLDLKGTDSYWFDHIPQSVHDFSYSDPRLFTRASKHCFGSRLTSLALGWSGEAAHLEAGREQRLLLPYGLLMSALEASALTLTFLDLSGSNLDAPVTAPNWNKSNLFPSLRHLNLSNTCHCPRDLLSVIQTTCLSELNLRACGWVFDVSMTHLLSHNHQLRRLNIGCTPLSAITLNAVSHSCPALQALDVCYTEEVTMQDLLDVCSRLGHITELGFSGLAGTSEVHVQALIRRYPGLVKLGLDSVQASVTSATYKLMAEHCPGLRKLYLGEHSTLTTQDYVALVSGCLDLHQISGTSHLANLEELGCYHLQPYSFDGDLMDFPMD